MKQSELELNPIEMEVSNLVQQWSERELPTEEFLMSIYAIVNKKLDQRKYPPAG